MEDQEIAAVIVGAFKEKSILRDLEKDADFFDAGASSLTVVDLQIQIESVLGLTAETSELMSKPTINGWVSIYSNVMQGAIA